MEDSVSPEWTVYVRVAGALRATTASVRTCPATAATVAEVVMEAEEVVSAACACGAMATSEPAIATAGAAFVAFPATTAAWDGVVCRPERRIFRGRRCS